MTQAEASAGTATNERLITAKVLSDTIDEKLVPVETNILIGIVDGFLQKNYAPTATLTATGGNSGAVNISNLKAGETYVVTFTASGAGQFYFAAGSYTQGLPNFTDGQSYVQEVTLERDFTTYRLYSGTTATITNIMITPKAVYDISSAYVPYSMSNVEITAWINAHS